MSIQPMMYAPHLPEGYRVQRTPDFLVLCAVKFVDANGEPQAPLPGERTTGIRPADEASFKDAICPIFAVLDEGGRKVSEFPRMVDGRLAVGNPLPPPDPLLKGAAR